MQVSEDLDLPSFYHEAVVDITLWDATLSQPVLGFNTLNSHTLAGVYRVVAAEDGTWTFDFVPNSAIEPPDTVWHIDRHISGCEVFTSNISVPATGGPYLVSDLEV